MLGDAPSCENLEVTGPVIVTELSFELGANAEMAATRSGVETREEGRGDGGDGRRGGFRRDRAG